MCSVWLGIIIILYSMFTCLLVWGACSWLIKIKKKKKSEGEVLQRHHGGCNKCATVALITCATSDHSDFHTTHLRLPRKPASHAWAAKSSSASSSSSDALFLFVSVVMATPRAVDAVQVRKGLDVWVCVRLWMRFMPGAHCCCCCCTDTSWSKRGLTWRSRTAGRTAWPGPARRGGPPTGGPSPCWTKPRSFSAPATWRAKALSPAKIWGLDKEDLCAAVGLGPVINTSTSLICGCWSIVVGEWQLNRSLF